MPSEVVSVNCFCAADIYRSVRNSVANVDSCRALTDIRDGNSIGDIRSSQDSIVVGSVRGGIYGFALGYGGSFFDCELDGLCGCAASVAKSVVIVILMDYFDCCKTSVALTVAIIVEV